MSRVIFVGDNPSKTNVRQDVAFVGAKCFDRLIGWIKYLDPDYYICLNSTSQTDLDKIVDLYTNGFKVIALGSKASERLDNLNVVHFKLIHPSGRNRLINDEKYVRRELKRAYDYIHNTFVGSVDFE